MNKETMELKDIKKRKYQGYVWMSDKKMPPTLNDEEFDFSDNIYKEPNPFVIEALLWCEGENVSIHVRHTGRYVINQFDLTELKKAGAEFVEKFYVPHRLDTDEKSVRFQQIWESEKDPLCNDMPVLTLKAVVFTGFSSIS